MGMIRHSPSFHGGWGPKPPIATNAGEAAAARISELNRLLLAIREVNRLIVREREPQQLLTKTCNLLP